MKKVSIACIAGLLFFAACENSGSSTVGTYEQDEPQSNNKEEEGAKEEAPKEEHNTREGVMTDTTLPAPSDTATMKADTTMPENK